MRRREITRADGALYMVRWYLFDCKYFGLKLHKILLSDHDCVHDHPWNFFSLLLKSGYVEHTEIPHGSGTVKVSKIYHPGNILYRKAEHRHKLEIHQPAWTLVFSMKRRRRWGFWTRTKWIHWKDFVPSQNCE